MLDHTTDSKQTYWKVLREHVFWSAFKTYPTWHSQRYESSLWTQMCWQSCPFAHKSNPVKKQLHIWLTYTDDTIQSTSIVKNSPLVYEKQIFKFLTWACFLVWIQYVSHFTFAHVWITSAETNVLAVMSLGTCVWTWKKKTLTSTWFSHRVQQSRLWSKTKTHLNCKDPGSHVSMFSYLDSIHIPLDICRCMSHHC